MNRKPFSVRTLEVVADEQGAANRKENVHCRTRGRRPGIRSDNIQLAIQAAREVGPFCEREMCRSLFRADYLSVGFPQLALGRKLFETVTGTAGEDEKAFAHRMIDLTFLKAPILH